MSLRKRSGGSIKPSGQTPIKPGRAAVEAKMRRTEIRLLAISTVVSMISAAASAFAAWQAAAQLKASKEIFQEANTNQGFSAFVSSLHTFCKRADTANGILGVMPIDLSRSDVDPVSYTYSSVGQLAWGKEQDLRTFVRSIIPMHEDVLSNLHSMKYYLLEDQYESLERSVDPLFAAVLALRSEANDYSVPRDAKDVAPLFINLDYRCRVLRSSLPDWYVARASKLEDIHWQDVQMYDPPPAQSGPLPSAG